MRVPSVKRILPEKFPDLKWVPEFVAPLNQFMEQVAQGLNRGLKIRENFDGVVQTVLVDMTAASPFPVRFKWTRTSKPTVAWIGQARELAVDHVTFTDPISLDWEYTGDGTFKINAIPGLPATAKFQVTIIALAE